MGLALAGNTPQGGSAQRLAFGFRVSGDVRFISHRDTLRLFHRALARAGLPVRFTEGFNPRPRMSIPLPRPVGLESQDELLLADFRAVVDPDDALKALARQMPAGVALTGVRPVTPGDEPKPLEARYHLDTGERSVDELTERIRTLLESDVLEISRNSPKTGTRRQSDVRPYLLDLRLVDGGVEFTIRITQTGTVRPAEIAGLLGYDEGSINHRIRRMEVRWH